MREQFNTLTDELSIPTWYGISALGTGLCVYICYESMIQRLEPSLNQRGLKRIREDSTGRRWNVDVTTLDGVAS
ncbi:hypothetical protein BDN67DRAFT_365075 [Paxillus ammoniavirescens]|nr:hypothetical protein BDN67DRAFT_365075 [Paxillus ammoniavirescens]